MVTMSYLLGDVTKMSELCMAAFNRRKQMCPFELEPDDIIDVMHMPMVARRVRELMSFRPGALHWDRYAMLLLPTGNDRLPTIRVTLKTNADIPLPVNPRVPADLRSPVQPTVDVECWTGPQTIRLLDWAWKAVQIELENRWALKILVKLFKVASTHQQIHRYAPEIYTLMAQQQERTRTNRFGETRLIEVDKELQEIGSRRATRVDLEGITIADRANLRAMVAQVMLLPAHDGLKQGSMFDETWVDLPSKAS